MSGYRDSLNYYDESEIPNLRTARAMAAELGMSEEDALAWLDMKDRELEGIPE